MSYRHVARNPDSPSLHAWLAVVLFVSGISSCVCTCQPGYESQTCCPNCTVPSTTNCRECGLGSASRVEDYNLRDVLPEWYFQEFSRRELDFWNDQWKNMSTCNVNPEWIQAQIVTVPVDASVKQGFKHVIVAKFLLCAVRPDNVHQKHLLAQT
jgi:hypothetical protein